MGEDIASTDPQQESLRVQLTEINNRSRWYSSELWQVPFAFLGVTGVVIAQLADKGVVVLGVAFGASALFGVFVIIHMSRIRASEIRAITNLQNTEAALHLPPTAKTRGGMKIFQVAVIFATVAYALAASALLSCARGKSKDDQQGRNKTVQRTGASRSDQETNQASAAAGSRR